ncbi:MAG: crossover junction endodeoxyribonuclease RuvC, partial [Planctomycetota bacterium]|nr:crossover junction endodeoxyribonuclease RuvC [Planctomycetota bacterium]
MASPGGLILPPGMRLRRRGGRRRRPPPGFFACTGASAPDPRLASASRFLGIDPGTRAMGYGLLERRGGGLAAIEYGVVRAPEGWPLERRLLRMYERLCGILDAAAPDVVAVEQIFGGRVPRGGLVLGQGRGVALLAVAQRKLPLVELSPAEIKKSVTGRGSASKPQVARMVLNLLAITLVYSGSHWIQPVSYTH